MQVKNNYDLEWTRAGEEGTGVFNGDIGYVTRINREEGGLTVDFDDGRQAEYDAGCLEELELAYCMSVHKGPGQRISRRGIAAVRRAAHAHDAESALYRRDPGPPPGGHRGPGGLRQAYGGQ